MEKRYCIVKEPCGGWTVWDNLVDQPAEIDGRVLIGLNSIKAETVCDVLHKVEELHRMGCATTLPPHAEAH